MGLGPWLDHPARWNRCPNPQGVTIEPACTCFFGINKIIFRNEENFTISIIKIRLIKNEAARAYEGGRYPDKSRGALGSPGNCTTYYSGRLAHFSQPGIRTREENGLGRTANGIRESSGRFPPLLPPFFDYLPAMWRAKQVSIA